MTSPVTLRAPQRRVRAHPGLGRRGTADDVRDRLGAGPHGDKRRLPLCSEAAPVARAESPAGYMKRVGNELLAASRSGSAAQFAMVLNSNADIPSIGLSALGDYARSLPKNDRPVYYNGMINFIARYASKEAPKYPVARFIVTAQSKERCARHLRRQPRHAGRRQRLRRALAGRQARRRPTRCATRR